MARSLPGQNSLKKAKAIWQIGLVIFITLAIPLTVIILRYVIDLRSSADPTEEPREVVISNIGNAEVTVSFETPNTKTRSTIKYGVEDETTNVSFDSRYQEGSDNLFNLHHHVITNLVPNTEYNFTITVGSQTYSSENFKFKTFEPSNEIAAPKSLKGTVEGNNFEEGIVYAHLENNDGTSTIISRLISPTGGYSFNLSLAKDDSGEEFPTNGSQLYVFANAASNGKGYIKITPPTGEDINEKIVLTSADYTYSPENLNQLSNTPDLPQPTATATSTPEPITTPENQNNEPTTQPSPVRTATPTQAVTQAPPPNNTTSDNILLTGSYDSPESATDPSAPYKILVSNLDSNTFTVNWLTKTPTTGSIVYGIEVDPNKQALDIRDSSLESQKARYSHAVNIIDNELSAEKEVEFRILVNGKEYSMGSENFLVKTPAVPPSPPSANSQDGTIDADNKYSDKSDFVILARVPGESTWISTTASSTTNWNLPYGSLMRDDLTGYISNPQELELEVYGNNNASGSAQIEPGDSLEELEVRSGITASIQNGSELKIGSSIDGQAEPNENVNIVIGSISGETRANSQGDWEYQIPPNAPTGEQQVTFSNAQMSLPYKVTLRRDLPTPTATVALTTTPDTAIEDYFFLLPGILILFVGFAFIPMGIKQNDDQIELD